MHLTCIQEVLEFLGANNNEIENINHQINTQIGSRIQIKHSDQHDTSDAKFLNNHVELTKPRLVRSYSDLITNN